jgi:hypothetical protein
MRQPKAPPSGPMSHLPIRNDPHPFHRADLSRHPSQEHSQAWRSIARTVLEAGTRPGSPRTLTHGAGHLVSSSGSSPKVTANWGSRSA